VRRRNYEHKLLNNQFDYSLFLQYKLFLPLNFIIFSARVTRHMKTILIDKLTLFSISVKHDVNKILFCCSGFKCTNNKLLKLELSITVQIGLFVEYLLTSKTNH